MKTLTSKVVARIESTASQMQTAGVFGVSKIDSTFISDPTKMKARVNNMFSISKIIADFAVPGSIKVLPSNCTRFNVSIDRVAELNNKTFAASLGVTFIDKGEKTNKTDGGRVSIHQLAFIDRGFVSITVQDNPFVMFA